MVQKSFQIKNQMGMHMRPAKLLVGELSSLDCTVVLSHNNNQINAKSMMDLMAACIRCDDYVTVICDGPDENEALEKAGKLIEDGFGE